MMYKIKYGLLVLFTIVYSGLNAQYKSFSLTPQGDTLNAVDNKGLKQGKWVNTVPELRGNPGYDEEGVYKDDKKEGVWRKYSAEGDLLAVENYKFGGKDGIQQYYTFLGSIEREEEWHSYNPDAPYDTIPIYGTTNNDIIEYKVVKATQYSVPHGTWKYFSPDGRVTKADKYERGRLIVDAPEPPAAEPVATEKPKEKTKPQEVLDYEKKYSKKKREHMEREGKTSL
ncbi:toxin-antitoxin system YwqK family antitoxin [Ferruginibacter sp. SUN002]|uniref:toxin-antitoxin system YwqK family antitoxin n=1 Tax=Ferruginibacter sp. SUN002 TaxID=2937789 RepID=UPI003D35F81C